MGISPKTGEVLRTLGHDAIHLHEQNLDQLPDRAILEKARHEERILLTHDLGFGDLIAASGANLPTVIIFRLRNMQPAFVNRYLRAIVARYADKLEQGVIMSVTEGQIRLRSLPLDGEG
jgi:predicted nuclease of predicted toxin-antitoxin system